MGAGRQRGRDVVQDVHGVPGRAPRRRRADLPRACSAPASSARSSACTPRTGSRSTCSSQQAARGGPHGADLPRAHAPADRRGRGHGARDRLAEMAGVPVYIVHLSARARARAGRRGARSRPARRTPRPARSTSSCSQDDLARPGLRGREVRVHAAAPPDAPSRGPVARPADPRSPGRLDRPLPVLHEGPEGARQGQLREDPERHARRRDAPVPAVGRRRSRRDASR